METKNIKKALDILRYRDWTWMMADDNYNCRYNAAKAEMKEFVATVKGIDDASIREALLRYWVMKFESVRASINGCSYEKEADLESLCNQFALVA